MQILKTQVEYLMLGNHEQVNKTRIKVTVLNPPRQMSDAGTYTLRGENRNGSDKVEGLYQKHHDHARHKGGLGPGGVGHGPGLRVRVAQVRKP